MLIAEIKEALPNIKIFIFEPFVLPGTATTPYWDAFSKEVPKRAEKARLIAQKYNLPIVSLQDKFNEAAKKAPNEYWLYDGVHPTPKGYELIKRQWLKSFKEMI